MLATCELDPSPYRKKSELGTWVYLCEPEPELDLLESGVMRMLSFNMPFLG